MKFCCERFKGQHQYGGIVSFGDSQREIYPNLKIVKLPANEYNGSTNLYRYLIVCGFIKDAPPVINIKFCPFCGVHLYDFYKTDEFVNGESTVFF
jgi:hypothetical protein